MVSTDHEWLQRVESRCGAVVLGRPCRLPPLSSGGAGGRAGRAYIPAITRSRAKTTVTAARRFVDVGEIGLGIETVQLGAFNEGVEDGGALPTLVGSQEEKIFTLRTRPAR